MKIYWFFKKSHGDQRRATKIPLFLQYVVTFLEPFAMRIPNEPIKLLKYSGLTFFLLILGCNDMGSHKDFGYHDANQVFEWGIVSARLLGKDIVLTSSDSIRETPYRLFVSIILPNKPTKDCHVQLRSLKIINLNNNIIASFLDQQEQFIKSNREYKSIFVFNDIKLNYEDYIVDLSSSLINCKETREIETKLSLNRNYQERNITFWDKLMGV